MQHNREVLKPHYLTSLQENTQSPAYKLEAFISAYISGDDTLSALCKHAEVSKPTAIKWKRHLVDVDEKYAYLLEYTSIASLESGADVPKAALVDPTSREFVLETLGWGLVKARENGNPDQIGRLAKQMADIQGYKAKEMGRDYDLTQRLGDEGINAVDQEVALCILAIAEHPQHYPQAILAIQQASSRVEALGDELEALGLHKPPSGTNDSLDAPSPTPMTDQLAIAHAAPEKNTSIPLLNSDDDPPEDIDLGTHPKPIDGVLDDLT